MATVKHIKIKNQNYNAAVQYLTYQHNEFTNKPILDKDGNMILRGGYLIDGINCSPFSFGRECAETNRAFNKNTGFNDIKAHHYIISFDPRDKEENNLTPEKAQALGMEIAKKMFPGHQIIVCTHPDGHNNAGNIHCHIVLNSVRKFTVDRRDFMHLKSDNLAGCKHHSTNRFLQAFKQKVMDVCQRENLYQIDLNAPAKVKITDKEYWAQRKGQQQIGNTQTKDTNIPSFTFETNKNYLRSIITSVMADSHSAEEFQNKLFEHYGIEVHESHNKYTYCIPQQGKPIRAKQLGTDYDKAFLDTYYAHQNKQYFSQQSSQNQDKESNQLVTDLQAFIKAQENPLYERKIKISNLKKLSDSLVFLQENNIGTEQELRDLLQSVKTDYYQKKSRLKDVESELQQTNRKIHYTGQYLANKNTYQQYLRSSNKQFFRQEHLKEITLYEAARLELKSITNGQKLISINRLKERKNKLMQDKNSLYEEFSHAKNSFLTIKTISDNLDLHYYHYSALNYNSDYKHNSL